MANIVTEGQAARWVEDLQGLHDRFKPCFVSRAAWSVAGGFLVGLLSSAERKSTWSMAEEVGEPDPYAFQHLLSKAVWDVECAQDVVAAYVYEGLQDVDGVHILDETGFVKKGTQSVGVQRQYTGTVGKTENCQVAVFLAYASPKGAALVDRALYLPESWTSDPERLKKAGVPDGTTLTTKSELGRRMLEQALATGAPKGWVAADEEYGKASALRHWLDEQTWPYVLGVAGNVTAWTDETGKKVPVPAVFTSVSEDGWRRLSAGAGEKGERWYDWAAVPITGEAPDGWGRWVLLRRSLSDGEAAYYLCAGPANTTLEGLVRVAGARWAIEVCFEQAKGEVGLDHYEVRTWKGWHRHITLSMAALAFLAVTRHVEAPKGGLKSRGASGMEVFRNERASQEPVWQAKRRTAASD